MNFKLCLVLAAIVILVPGLPAMAEDEDAGDPSFYVMVEGALTGASGAGGIYTLSGEEGFVPIGTLHSIDLDEAVAPRLSFGWKTGGGWLVLWWSRWDDDTTDSVSATAPFVLWDTLFHSDPAWGEFEGTASAVRGVDAGTIDLTYSRQFFSSDKVTASWTFGLRQASLDHRMDVVYNDATDLHLVNLSSEAEGFGLIADVSGAYELSKKWFVTAGFQYSFLSGEVEARTQMIETDIPGTFVSLYADVTSEEDRVFSTFMTRSSLVWHPADPWYFWLGYELTRWNDVVETILFPDDWSPGFVQTDTTGISFDGFTLGAAYTF